MPHSKPERERLLGRIHRLQGQLAGLGKLLEREDYDNDVCYEVMRLLASIKGATRGLTDAYLEGYVKDHIVKQNGRLDSAALDEFMEILKTFRA